MVERWKRWFAIWKAQFHLSKMSNNRCERNDEVLIIKLDAIGDFVIWLDSAKEYRNLFPQKKLCLLCNEICRLIAENTGYFDKVFTVDMKKFEVDKVYFSQIINQMKSLSFEALIQTEYSRTLHMDMLAALIPAREKIGYECDESRLNLSRSFVLKKNKRRLDYIYDRIIPADVSYKMELKRNADFIRGLGLSNFKSSTPKLKTNEKEKGLVPGESYFIIFPGGSSQIKSWRIEHFAEVTDYLLNKTDMVAYICGSKAESNLYDQIVQYSCYQKRVVNYCGKTNLLQLAEIVRGARIVVTNDTSGAHFAAATGVKAVCIMGDQSYGRFLPYDADANQDHVMVCDANVRCKGCVYRGMSMKCIVHILLKRRYLCVDLVKVSAVKSVLDRAMIE